MINAIYVKVNSVSKRVLETKYLAVGFENISESNAREHFQFVEDPGMLLLDRDTMCHFADDNIDEIFIFPRDKDAVYEFKFNTNPESGDFNKIQQLSPDAVVDDTDATGYITAWSGDRLQVKVIAEGFNIQNYKEQA